MNPTPRLNYKGHNRLLENESCGLLAMENFVDYFWQSRATVAGERAEIIHTVNLKQLATQTWGHHAQPRPIGA